MQQLQRLLRAACLLMSALIARPLANAAESPKVAGLKRPNIVLILADDLGYGDLGCYGQVAIETPRLDQLAAAGMRWTDFYAGSTVCAPSRCTLMTGLHTGHCQIRGNANQNLAAGTVTLAGLLRDAGYRTGVIGKWGLGTERGTGVPTRQGFDYFYGYIDQVQAHNYYPTFLLRNETRVPLKNVVPNERPSGAGVASVRAQYSPDLLQDEALRFIDENKERPFFLYVPMTLPHANNEAGNRGMEVPDLGFYANKGWPEPEKGRAAMITRMDRYVGQIVDRLKQHGIQDRTIVLFSSDNGPHSEGGSKAEFNHSSGPFRGYKRDLYEGGIRVPLIACWPGRIAAGSTTVTVGAMWDLLPTLAQFGGVDPKLLPKNLDGISLAPVLLGDKQPTVGERSFYWVFYELRGAQAVRVRNWKAVEQPLGTQVQLYDLNADPGETQNLAGKHPDIVAELREFMARSYTPSAAWPLPGHHGQERQRRAEVGRRSN